MVKDFKGVGDKDKRNGNFEILRIISIAAVFLFHLLYELPASDMPIYNRVLTVLFGSWGIVGVNCFFMISFYFLIGRDKVDVTRTVWLLLAAYLYLFLGQVLTHFVTGAGFGGIKSFLRTPFGMWYIPAYIIMVWVCPYLNILEKKLTDRSLGNLIIVLTVIFAASRTLVERIVVGDILVPVYAYFWMAYLKRNPNGFLVKFRYLFLALSVFAVLSYGCYRCVYKGSNLYGLLEERSSMAQFAVALALFTVFSKLKIKNGAVISFYSRSTFCVYVTQMIFAGVAFALLNISAAYLMQKPYGIPALIALVIAVMTLCSAIDLVRRYVEKKIRNISFVKNTSDFINRSYNPEVR